MFKIIDTPLSGEELNYIQDRFDDHLFPPKSEKEDGRWKVKRDYRISNLTKRLKKFNERNTDHRERDGIS